MRKGVTGGTDIIMINNNIFQGTVVQAHNV